jgi:pilus assembly protein CpaD
LQVDGAEARIDLAFAPGSARLARANAIYELVTTGRIRAADRVTVAASGPPGLAEQRTAAISRELLRYGIVADALPAQIVPANHAILGIGRYAVSLPPCPNWSSPPGAAYTNAPTSNWGCATATNLGLTVANPADLVTGRSLGPAEGMPATMAVQNYLNNKFKPLPTPTASPFASGGGVGGDGGAAPGGAGAGGGTP